MCRAMGSGVTEYQDSRSRRMLSLVVFSCRFERFFFGFEEEEKEVKKELVFSGNLRAGGGHVVVLRSVALVHHLLLLIRVVLVVGADGNAQLVQLDKVVAVIGELEGGHLVRTTADTTTAQAAHIRLLHAGHQFSSIGGLLFLVIIKVNQLKAIGRWTAVGC
ncbi:hypothetical protein TYRP_016252 [Tyrophagus putrescentiae]|nr:hypothetical protein TYRP_016252 [Tyrophagus putrescentiae]